MLLEHVIPLIERVKVQRNGPAPSRRLLGCFEIDSELIIVDRPATHLLGIVQGLPREQSRCLGFGQRTSSPIAIVDDLRVLRNGSHLLLHLSDIRQDSLRFQFIFLTGCRHDSRVQLLIQSFDSSTRLTSQPQLFIAALINGQGQRILFFWSQIRQRFQLGQQTLPFLWHQFIQSSTKVIEPTFVLRQSFKRNRHSQRVRDLITAILQPFLVSRSPIFLNDFI